MTRSALKLAMDRVDAGEDIAAADLKWDPFPSDRPPNPEFVKAEAEKAERAKAELEQAQAAERAAEQAIRDQIETARGKAGRAYARASAVIAEALHDAGIDHSHIPDAAALYERAIGDMLLEVASMVPKPTGRRFGAESDAAALARGAAVADVLGGQP